MTDTIEPAITPDVWKAMLADDQFPSGLLPSLVMAQSFLDGNAIDNYLFKMVATFNAALLDDDPRKITRADVSALRALAHQNPDRLMDYGRPYHALAAKLAALLPPE